MRFLNLHPQKSLLQLTTVRDFCFLYMMNHGIFREPIFRLTRESASQIVQAFIGIQHTKF